MGIARHHITLALLGSTMILAGLSTAALAQQLPPSSRGTPGQAAPRQAAPADRSGSSAMPRSADSASGQPSYRQQPAKPQRPCVRAFGQGLDKCAD